MYGNFYKGFRMVKTTVTRKSMARAKLQKLLSANGENFQSGLLELYGVFSFFESLVLKPT